MSIQERTKRSRLKMIVGATFLVGGGFLFVLERENFILRSIGILLCALGAFQVKSENTSRQGQNAEILHETAPLIPKIVWCFGVFIALLTAVSFGFLYKDALDGYHGAWQVYTFASISFIFASTWGYITAKLRKR